MSKAKNANAKTHQHQGVAKFAPGATDQLQHSAVLEGVGGAANKAK